jgi:ribosomal protein S18 acetylase RimI-like enzyme
MERLRASVEEACLNAWPALKEIYYDGWLLRFAQGETRRTNSVNVLAPGARGLDEKIAYCEHIYADHGLPAYFRIRSYDDPALGEALDARGFRAEDDTRTLFLDFAATPPGEASRNVEMMDGPPSAEWFAAHERFTGQPSTDVRRRLLDLVAIPAAFAAVRAEDGAIASVAYGAIHDRILNLQWVATDPARRRGGFSRATLSELLLWAEASGAEGACLQVVADNTPAVALYESMGFDREVYRYHYRVR